MNGYAVAMPHRTFAAVALVVLTAWIQLGGCRAAEDAASRARDIERRILAPCCLRETVDVHESELAHELRREIRARVDAGESSQGIEADLVRRYGEQVRALPPGRDPRWMVEVALAVALTAGAVLIVVVGIRGRRRARVVAAATVAPLSPEDAERLDDELLGVD